MRRGSTRAWRNTRQAFIDSHEEFVCYLCQKHIDRNLKHPHPESLSVDHIVAVSNGGTDDWENLSVVHLVCNQQKKDKSLFHPDDQIIIDMASQRTFPGRCVPMRFDQFTRTFEPVGGVAWSGEHYMVTFTHEGTIAEHTPAAEPLEA